MSAELLRQNEQHCREQASLSPAASVRWLRMANEWAELAGKLERREAEEREAGASDPPAAESAA